MPIRNSTRIIAPGLEPCRLPPTRIMAFFACHGTPTNDNQYLIEEASERPAGASKSGHDPGAIG